jgi:transcriptional regulator with XRE-family HTH domain
MSIGEHIRAKRRERQLLQRDVAGQIGVAAETISSWEKSGVTPPVGFMPAVIHFLGYDPNPEPVTLSERMRDYRRKHGLTIKEAARRIGIDESSWGGWERAGLIPWTRYRTLVEEFLVGESRRGGS